MVQFVILSHANTVLMVWSHLGGNTSWLRLGNVLTYLVLSPQHTTGKYADILLKIYGGVTFINIGMPCPPPQTRFVEMLYCMFM